MQRILNWFFDGKAVLPAFFAEDDYSPKNLRLYSTDKSGKACQVDIRDDGVSILTDYAQLPAGQNLDEMAGSFVGGDIAEGSVITCHMMDTGGGANVSIQFEMESLS